MKKIVVIVIAALLIAAVITLCVVLTGRKPVETPDTNQPDSVMEEMTGTVLEAGDGYYLIQNTDGQQVQVNVHEGTEYAGETPVKGALIHIIYNGMMTRSLPPQINADVISCYVRTGAVVELTEKGFTLDDGSEIIEVNAEASLLEGIETGDKVSVYFNGAMTMSLPAQIGAELIVPAAE